MTDGPAAEESCARDAPVPAPAPVRVRHATRADMPVVHAMIQELANYEGVPEGPDLTVADLINDGFESSPAWFFALVAEREGRGEGGEGGEPVVVGYAICNRAYSSWTRRALYLEDLYVREAERGGGAGRALVRRVCALAAAARCSRLDWHVLEDNARARRFYSRLGARDLRTTEGRLAMRLDRTHIDALALEDDAHCLTTTATAPPAPGDTSFL